MKIFVDTEFDQDSGPDVRLISIGAVREDGAEYYAEADWTDLSNLSPWLNDNVVPHLMGGPVRLSREDMLATLIDFAGPEPEWWGFCVTPETKVLRSDLRWVPIGEIEVGDHLVSFDEHRPPGKGRSDKWRHWREGVVETASRIMRPCYELTFSDGTEVVCSSDHQWLGGAKGEGPRWVKAESMIAGGEGGKRTWVLKPLDVWETDNSPGAGYLAAAYDGEGHLTQKPTGPKQYNQTRLGFAQRDNQMLDKVEAELKERGFDFTKRAGPGINGDVYRLIISQRDDVLRLLGSVRPVRLLPKLSLDKLGSLGGQRNRPREKVALVSKEFVGPREVVALGVDRGTYVAEGLASHNCCAYDYLMLCQIHGGFMNKPDGWPHYMNDLAQFSAHLGIERAQWPDQAENEHHALADARWNAEVFEWLTGEDWLTGEGV